MLSVLFMICFIVMLAGIFFIEDYDVRLAVFVISFLGVVVFGVTGAVCVSEIIEGRYIDERIALYESENAEIEQNINELVKQYMQYEADTYSNLKGESGITLVSLYPELKSNELVQEQCDLYISNKKCVLELKEQRIRVSENKWWLYFGK